MGFKTSAFSSILFVLLVPSTLSTEPTTSSIATTNEATPSDRSHPPRIYGRKAAVDSSNEPEATTTGGQSQTVVIEGKSAVKSGEAEVTTARSSNTSGAPYDLGRAVVGRQEVESTTGGLNQTAVINGRHAMNELDEEVTTTGGESQTAVMKGRANGDRQEEEYEVTTTGGQSQSAVIKGRAVVDKQEQDEVTTIGGQSQSAVIKGRAVVDRLEQDEVTTTGGQSQSAVIKGRAVVDRLEQYEVTTSGGQSQSAAIEGRAVVNRLKQNEVTTTGGQSQSAAIKGRHAMESKQAETTTARSSDISATPLSLGREAVNKLDEEEETTTGRESQTAVIIGRAVGDRQEKDEVTTTGGQSQSAVIKGRAVVDRLKQDEVTTTGGQSQSAVIKGRAVVDRIEQGEVTTIAEQSQSAAIIGRAAADGQKEQETTPAGKNQTTAIKGRAGIDKRNVEEATTVETSTKVDIATGSNERSLERDRKSNASRSLPTDSHEKFTPAAQREKEDIFKHCEFLTEKERQSVVHFRVSSANLTVAEWYQEVDAAFRTNVALGLTNYVSGASFDERDVAYVNDLGRGQVAYGTLQIYVFLRNEKATKAANASVMVAVVKDSLKSCNTTCEVVDGSLGSGLPWPDCNSLFHEYLALWIILIVVVAVIVVASVALTWHCWRRGKSVDLQAKVRLSFPSQNQLRREPSLQGEDNPTLVLESQDNAAARKKRAPPPPAPEMSSFGKGADQSAVQQFETGIEPYRNDDSAPNGASEHQSRRGNGQGREISDTKF